MFFIGFKPGKALISKSVAPLDREIGTEFSYFQYPSGDILGWFGILGTKSYHTKQQPTNDVNLLNVRGFSDNKNIVAVKKRG